MSRPVLAFVLFLTAAACVPPSSQPSSASSAQAVQDQAAKMRQKAQQQIDAGQPVDVAAEQAALKKSVDDAAQHATGGEAAVMRASSKALETIQQASAKHQAALQGFLDAGGLDPAALSADGGVTTSRQKLDAFCQANDDMRRVIVTLPDDFAKIAQGEGASAAEAEAARKGFLSTFPQASLLQLRKMDADFCGQARTQLDLLAKHSGKWKASDGTVLFDRGVPDTDIASFNATVQAINQIGQDQTELQKKLIAQ